MLNKVCNKTTNSLKSSSPLKISTNGKEILGGIVSISAAATQRGTADSQHRQAEAGEAARMKAGRGEFLVLLVS